MKEITIPDDVKVFVTSDTHYGHRNILKYCQRPWLSEEEKEQLKNGVDFKPSYHSLAQHDTALVNNINDTVGEDDVLIHCGDVAWKDGTIREFRSRIKVKRVIVTFGNHDNDDKILKHFPEAFERVMIIHAERKAIVEHYPGDSWLGSHKGNWLLYGHIHGVGHRRRLENPSWQLSQDCGVDLHDFKPWSWEAELKPMFDRRRSNWSDWRAAGRDKNRGGMAPRD